MIDKVLIVGRSEAVIYYTDGRVFTIHVDQEILLETLHQMLYSMESAPCTALKAA